VRTSEFLSIGQPVPELVPELVPVLVMRCPVPVLAICAFGYLHIYHTRQFYFSSVLAITDDGQESNGK
jgi:hypothetical protein